MGWKKLTSQRARHGTRFATLAGAFIVGLLGVAAILPASAQLSGAKTTGVSSTKHNLGGGGTGVNRVGLTDTTEVCVFCHTPHAANTAAGPLWNRPATSATITPYTSSTLLGGTTADVTTADTPGSVSLACLSCHDGVTATNTLINKPGSGGWTATTGSTFGTLASGTGLVTGVAAIGGDLTNDHPIGVKYAGGRAAADQAAGGYVQVSSGTIGGGTAFWVDTGATGTAPGTSTDTARQKTDMFLYARSGTPYVECASCHDPHTSNDLFLRIPNAYSSVCLSCHIK